MIVTHLWCFPDIGFEKKNQEGMCMNVTTLVMGAIAWPLLCHAESLMVHAIVRSCDCFGLSVNNGVINLSEGVSVLIV